MQPTSEAAPIDGSSTRLVVVVEDEFLVRLTAVELLADAGFNVLEASNADEALGLLASRAGEVALLLTDVRMPGSMDGAELACLTRRQWPWIKILVVSGNLRPPAGAMPAGCDFLPKPYEPSIVVKRIAALLAAGASGALAQRGLSVAYVN